MPGTPWLRRWSSHPAPALRLVCLPYAGGGASMFRDWVLPEELATEVWAGQLPGRENRWRETPLRDTPALVTALAAELRPLLDRPVVFYGHSMGALLAFELARELRRLGLRQPAHLFVGAHRAPDLPPWRPAASALPWPQLTTRLREMAGQSSTVLTDPEVLLAVEPLLRADLEVCDGYRYRARAPLDMPITCFGAADDPEVRLDEIAAWQRLTTGPCRVREMRGGHLFLRDQADEILAEIAGSLATGGRL